MTGIEAHTPNVARQQSAQITVPGALSGLRVIDMSDSALQYCGKLYAHLGAEVVLVEPLQGCATRREGPFVKDVPHRERSLSFAYLNQGKQGLCLDIAHEEGRRVFERLVGESDLLIESTPGVSMEVRPESALHGASTQASSCGLDYADLAVLNPRLVVTSISPFGRTGPYASYQASDLVTMALGGLLYLGGYPETEPVGAPGSQAYLAAAQFAAVASLSALLEAENEQGNGQHVDVSIQECVAMALENAVQFAELEGTVRMRNGGQQRQAGTGVFACRDGLIYLMAGGIASNRFWATTTQWLIDGGAPGAAQLADAQWNDPAWLARDEAKAIFHSVFMPFAAVRTKAELYEDAQRRRIPLCPVSTTRDLLENRQLHYRNYFQSVPHPFSGEVLTMPGAPYGLSRTPWVNGRSAPRLGEHNAAILGRLGYDLEAQSTLMRAGVTG
jgi:benzylsuccinate CoA-transferase BbsE subunit